MAAEKTPFQRLVAAACDRGWARALLEDAMERVRRGVPPSEDERSADWLYAVDCDPPACGVLVVGCGLGIVPLALAKRYRYVVVVDGEWDRLVFLAQCKKEKDPLFTGMAAKQEI